MTQASQQTKFRWTESLTCRFIQLRKENGKLFTGRKYSAQAGWEYILQQMREEFPTFMANVPYRVLKKKWSNLLQQYKELKNPVHGDRNKADDVSWPFYGAIDEVLGHGRRTPSNDEYIDPQEFLCVSVTPEEPTSSVEESLPARSNPEIDCKTTSLVPEQRLDSLCEDCPIEIERILPREPTRQTSKNYWKKKRDMTKRSLISRLPRATELSIEKVTSATDCPTNLSSRLRRNHVESSRNKGQAATTRNGDGERPRNSKRTRAPCHEDHESRIDRRIEQIFEYTKLRDEENRAIMVRIMHAVETIADMMSR